MSSEADSFDAADDIAADGFHPLDNFGEPHFRCLGVLGKIYYFQPTKVPDVLDLSPSELRSTNLMRLAPLEWWQRQYPAKSGKEGGVDWTAAINAIMRACLNRGTFDPSASYGRGAAIVRGHFVFNLGDQLVVDGRTQPSMSVAGEQAFFAPGPPLRLPAGPYRDFSAEALVEALGTFGWRDSFAAKLMGGWVAIAPIAGALDRRPHIWIEGDRGSGKTTLLKFVADLLGPFAVIAEGGTTEAGLRQKQKGDALPVLLDESESRDDRSEERVARLVETARSSYSSSGAILKGTQAGRGIQYAARSAFCFASIAHAITAPADRTRIIVLPLREPPKGRQLTRSRELCESLKANGFGGQLVAQSIRRFQAIKLSARVFADAIIEAGAEPRAGDTVGTLLAGWWSLQSDRPISAREASGYLDGDFKRALALAAAPTDADLAFQHLLANRIALTSSTETTLAAFIEESGIFDPEHDGTGTLLRNMTRSLALRGFRVEREEGGNVLFVSTTGPAVDRHFERTPWAKTWRHVLAQSPTARTVNGRMRFGGHRSAALAIEIPAD